jgi:hypothetical protein
MASSLMPERRDLHAADDGGPTVGAFARTGQHGLAAFRAGDASAGKHDRLAPGELHLANPVQSPPPNKVAHREGARARTSADCDDRSEDDKGVHWVSGRVCGSSP